MKIDGGSVMGSIAKSTGHALGLLDLSVDRLSQRIGDPMLGVGHDVVDVGFKRLGGFFDGFEA